MTKVADIYREEPSLTLPEWVTYLRSSPNGISLDPERKGTKTVGNRNVVFNWKGFTSLSDIGSIVVFGDREFALETAALVAVDLSAELIPLSLMLPAYREMVDELEDQYVWIYVDFDRPRKRILAKLGMVNEKWGGSVYYTAYCEDSLSGQEGGPCCGVTKLNGSAPQTSQNHDIHRSTASVFYKWTSHWPCPVTAGVRREKRHSRRHLASA